MSLSVSNTEISSQQTLHGILALAASRKDVSQAHNGDVTAKEAYNFCLKNDAIIIDVRTKPEWIYVGLPDTHELKAKLLCISFMLYPDYDINIQFLEELKTSVADTSTPLFFLCKVGGRSLNAACAAAQAGYKYSFNIAGGFEGPPNQHGQRGVVSGWKAEGCAWNQS